MVERVELGTQAAPEQTKEAQQVNQAALDKANSQQDLQIKDLNTGETEEIQADEQKYDPNAEDNQDGDFKVPEKFEGKSTEEVIKAYLELEKSKGQKEEQEKTPEEAKTAEEAQAKIDEQFSKWSQEYLENGRQLTPETVDQISKDMKIPKEYVETYVAGVNALHGNYTDAVLKGAEVDSEDYPNLMEWGKANFTDKELEAFNRATDGSSKESAIMAIKDLKAKYQGDEPNLADGNKGSNYGSNDVYRSEKELTKDMSDERYQTGDTAFIAYVQEKLGRSDIM